MRTTPTIRARSAAAAAYAAVPVASTGERTANTSTADMAVGPVCSAGLEAKAAAARGAMAAANRPWTGRQAGELGVGERLRDHDERDAGPGEQVGERHVGEARARHVRCDGTPVGPGVLGGRLCGMWRSVFVPTVALAFAEGMLVPVLPLFVASLGVPFWWVGLVLAGEAIGMLVGDLPAGTLLRRVDRKVAMLLGIALVGVAALGAAFVDAVVAIFVLRLLAGLGAALWGISRHAFLADAVPLHRRGRMIAAFGGAQRIGSLAGPAVGGLVAAVGGFSAAFLVYAGVAAVTLTYCWRYLSRRRRVGRRDLARAHPGVARTRLHLRWRRRARLRPGPACGRSAGGASARRRPGSSWPRRSARGAGS